MEGRARPPLWCPQGPRARATRVKYQSEGGWRLAVPRTAYAIPGRVGLGRTWRRRVRFRCFRFRFRPVG